VYLLPFISGALSIFAFPPFSIPILPFVGLVPFILWLERPRTGNEVLVGGLAFAVPYFVGNIYWMFNLIRFTPAGWGGALGSIAMHWITFFLFPITISVLRRYGRAPFVLAIPSAWVISEHARSFGDLAFPWVTLGYSLSEWPSMIQHADIVGVYGISWWLVFVNSVVAMMVVRRNNPGAVGKWGAVLAVALLIPGLYNAWRWQQIEGRIATAPSVAISVIQPNVAQGMKWNPATARDTLANVNRLISDAENDSPALVVGPEACLPLVQSADADRLPPGILPGRSPLLIGVVTGIGDGDTREVQGFKVTSYARHYNSAFLADAERAILARHDKQYLVPVTEQVPYSRVFGFLLPFYSKHFGRFRPADSLSLMEVPGSDPAVEFGTLICYESMFPRLVSRMRRMGASFFVNITNDAWFGRTTFPWQHAGFCALRAIENRAGFARSANTGVSTFVDPLGRQQPRSGIFHDAVLTGRVSVIPELTIYNRVGDVVLFLSYPVVGLFLWLALGDYRRQSS
jgi:apolipoprotein N-acyltransferase